MNEKLTIVAVTFGQAAHHLPVLLHSLELQTRRDFKVEVWHDGPITCEHSKESASDTQYLVKSLFNSGEFPCTFNLTYIESDVHYHYPGKEDWGHTLRAQALEKVDTEWINLTNGDNYYTPKFVEFMLSEAEKSDLDFVFCDLLHNYPNVNGDGRGAYHVLDSRAHVNRIDMCNFIVKTKLAQEVGFNHRGRDADGLFVMDLRAKYPELKIGKLTSVLMVHN
jgi:hypothetical protein